MLSYYGPHPGKRPDAGQKRARTNAGPCPKWRWSWSRYRS